MSGEILVVGIEDSRRLAGNLDGGIHASFALHSQEQRLLFKDHRVLLCQLSFVDEWIKNTQERIKI